MQEQVDVVSARINLLQFFALKLNVEGIEGSSKTLNAYLQGTLLFATPNAEADADVTPNRRVLDANEGFPLRFRKVIAVKDIFAVYYELKKLKSQLEFHKRGVGKGTQPVSIILLGDNVNYVLEILQSVCSQVFHVLHRTWS
jgi:hypothetical protein